MGLLFCLIPDRAFGDASCKISRLNSLRFFLFRMFNQPDGGDREAEKQNLVMKTVIALQGRSNTGKTETLNWLIDKLVEHGMAVTEQDSAASDRLAIGSYRKVNVGVVTQGDPGGKMKEWLDRCMAAECAVIVCACRSKGSTPYDLDETAKPNGYQSVWTTPYFSHWGSMCGGIYLDEVCAESLLHFINRLIDDIEL